MFTLLLFSAIDGLDKGVEKSEENGEDGSPLPPDPTLPEGGGENNDGMPGNTRFLAKNQKCIFLYKQKKMLLNFLSAFINFVNIKYKLWLGR